MSHLEIILTILAGSGWAAVILQAVLASRKRETSYPSHADTITKRVTLLRSQGMELLESSALNTLRGYPATATQQRIESDRMFAEADRLDPPVPPGGGPGRLSLVPPIKR
jgi:hypothetical protein